MTDAPYSLHRKTRDWLARGPFGKHIDRFLEHQVSMGYNSSTTKWQVYSIIHFGDWLCRHGRTLDSVVLEDIREFNAPRRNNRPKWSGTAIRVIVELITGRTLGRRVDETRSEFKRQAEPVIGSFASYLRTKRGLAETTNSRYVGLVQTFLSAMEPSSGPTTNIATILGLSFRFS